VLPPGNITKFYYTFNYSTSSPVTWHEYDPAESSTSSAPSYTYPSPGKYIVAIKAVKLVDNVDIDEALATQTVTIPDANALTCTATATPTAGYAPLSVNFGGSASGGSGSYSYQWHFGDGATSSVATTTHQYASVTSSSWMYHAFLNVTDGNASTICPVSPITITADYCDPNLWSPSSSDFCFGQPFTQTNTSCNETRNATGTKECGCSLSASPRAVITGQPSRLNWSCHGLSSTTTCSLSDVASTTVGAGTSGVLVRPRQTTTYTLTCNPALPVTADTQVWVGFIPVLKEIIPQW
jgi:PKD repeat protein